MRTLSLSLSLLLPLTAQEPPTAQAPQQPATTTKDRPVLRIVTVGPAMWRQMFLPTNLGALLSSNDGEALWERPSTDFDRAWQRLLKADDAAFATVRGRVLDYTGRVEIAVFADPPKPGTYGHTASGFVIVYGDGTTDLDALAKDLTQLLAAATGEEWREQEVGGGKRRVLSHEAGDRVTAPERDGERLVSAWTTNGEIERAFARLPAATPAPKPRELAGGPALSMRLDVQAALAAEEATDRAWQKALGLGTLGELTLAVSATGPHVGVELAQTFLAGDRGLFAALFPDVQGLPSVLRLVPSGLRQWKGGRVALGRTYEAIERAIAASEGVEPKELRARVKEEIGCDPVADVLGLLGDELLLCGDFGPGDGGAAAAGEGEEGTFCLAAPVRDEARFAAGLRKLLADMPVREQEDEASEHHGVRVMAFGTPFGDTPLRAAVGEGVFVFAAGQSAERQLKAMLDAARAARAGDAAAAAPELPAALRRLQRSAPAGLNGAAELDLSTFLAAQIGLVLEVMREATPPGADLVPPLTEADVAKVAELLRRHQLDKVRTLTGNADARWCLRAFW